MLKIARRKQSDPLPISALTPDGWPLTPPPEPMGKWYGGGQEGLGVYGTVQPDDLSNLFRGLSADGSRKLVQNANHENRQCARDLTLSVDKSVSAAFALASAQQRAVVEETDGCGIEAGLKCALAAVTRPNFGHGSAR